MKRIIVIIGSVIASLVLGLMGCQEPVKKGNGPDGKTEKIVWKKNEYEALAPSVVDSIRFLKLNEDEEAFLKGIHQIKIYRDTIYVFDRLGQNKLVSFDKAGHFIQQFSRKGNGPEEYALLWDFDVDAQYVYLYDRASMRMLYYTHTGKFIKSQSTLFRAKSFVALANGNFLFSLEKGNDGKEVCLTDSSLAIQKTYLSYQKEETDDRITDNLFQKVNDTIYYNKVVNDSVYVFSNQGELLKCMLFDFNGENVPKEAQQSYAQLVTTGGKEEYTYFYDCPMICHHKIIGSVFHRGKKGVFLYDEEKQQGGIKEWIPQQIGLSDIILPLTSTSNYVVGWMESSIWEVCTDSKDLSPDLIKHLEKGGRILVFYYIH